MIDFHVHLFSSEDLPSNTSGLPYSMPKSNVVKMYLDRLMALGIKPELINNVHLSILPDSENVFNSFSELDRLKQFDPELYGGIVMVGTILACPKYATTQRLSHPQVKGVRVVLHDAYPDTVLPQSYSSDDWLALYARLRTDQHIHIYAQEPEVNLKVLKQIPESLPVVIDHLGSCRVNKGIADKYYQALLKEAKIRGNVWFKGPGYRTSNSPEAVLPFTSEIIKKVGANRLILESTDAPHVGTDTEGVPYDELYDLKSALEFTHSLARLTSNQSNLESQSLLREAYLDILNPIKRVRK